MNSDYIILIDEYGQPYLAHAWGARKDHKYKLKVDNYYAPGKHLYLYTDAEVRAFTKRGKVKLSAKIKDKLGWDERSERDEAEEKYKRMSVRNQGSNAQRDRVLQERNQKQEVYSKTLLGRIEGFKNRHNRDSMGVVRAQNEKQTNEQKERQRTAEKNVRDENLHVKGRKLDRWLRKNITEPLQELSRTGEKKATEVWNDLREEGKRQAQFAKDFEEEKQRRAEEQLIVQPEEPKEKNVVNPDNKSTGFVPIDMSKAAQPEKKSDEKTSNKATIIFDDDENNSNRNTANIIFDEKPKAVYGTYTKNDDDFNADYWTENARIGDTDFFIFKNKDGRTVIGEEDMKWVLPEGVSPNSSKIKAAIVAFDEKIANERAKGNYYTSDDWEELANDTINKAVAEELKNNK